MKVAQIMHAVLKMKNGAAVRCMIANWTKNPKCVYHLMQGRFEGIAPSVNIGVVCAPPTPCFPRLCL